MLVELPGLEIEIIELFELSMPLSCHGFKFTGLAEMLEFPIRLSSHGLD